MTPEVIERMVVVKGDITELQVDAIVNSANSTLLGDGGVDDAIHDAAGPRLRTACAALDGCPTGGAKMTAGFSLPAKHVIHTVGPVYSDGTNCEADLLRSCYRTSLRLAAEANVETIAFPCISPERSTSRRPRRAKSRSKPWASGSPNTRCRARSRSAATWMPTPAATAHGCALDNATGCTNGNHRCVPSPHFLCCSSRRSPSRTTRSRSRTGSASSSLATASPTPGSSTRFPDKKFELVNLGPPSETATGLSEPDHPFWTD